MALRVLRKLWPRQICRTPPRSESESSLGMLWPRQIRRAPLHSMRDMGGDGIYGVAAMAAGFVGLFTAFYLSHKAKDLDEAEAAMKARFHHWMKEHGRSYSTEEEKLRRFEIFKKTAMYADKENALKPRGLAPNGLADWTDEECDSLDLVIDDEEFEVIIREAVKQAEKNFGKGRHRRNNS